MEDHRVGSAHLIFWSKRGGIDFDAMDGKPVHFSFYSSHLRIQLPASQDAGKNIKNAKGRRLQDKTDGSKIKDELYKIIATRMI